MEYRSKKIIGIACTGLIALGAFVTLSHLLLKGGDTPVPASVAELSSPPSSSISPNQPLDQGSITTSSEQTAPTTISGSTPVPPFNTPSNTPGASSSHVAKKTPSSGDFFKNHNKPRYQGQVTDAAFRMAMTSAKLEADCSAGKKRACDHLTKKNTSKDKTYGSKVRLHLETNCREKHFDACIQLGDLNGVGKDGTKSKSSAELYSKAKTLATDIQSKCTSGANKDVDECREAKQALRSIGAREKTVTKRERNVPGPPAAKKTKKTSAH